MCTRKSVITLTLLMLLRDFLPEVDQYGGVLLWNNIARKDKDWCEEFLHTEENHRKSSLGSLYSCVISVDQVVEWYEKRIKEIEELSGIVSHALDLTRLGIQRNITVSKRDLY